MSMVTGEGQFIGLKIIMSACLSYSYEGGELPKQYIWKGGVSLMTVFEAISLMITFSIFVVALITLVVELAKLFHNKK